ncbi:hypothetical protein BIV57_02865 [Mangrovactinospora gilvigrisea]|uniref:FAD-binding domain-containing protein n=1 Tax=Mangrovactinospora gilvigrisea TaxID=1428644 RepID=A0A1J7BJW2_9ACTN|nr:FAD-dependent monooxygenase [Mangrovactinospora gilvigrisea]OIV38926.1 hypothetical protein BIV57_02865 [Mangrovactinospora gilvigrisea]
MTDSQDLPTDVLIAGAGPNGLLLAAELRLAGVRATVLEPLAERTRVPRANGLVGQVVGALDRRGLYEPLAGRPGPPDPAPGFTFGGLPLALNDLDPNPLTTLMVPQTRIEEVLEARALELGAEIRRGLALTGFAQDEDGVDVEAAPASGGAPVRLRARYLVGADGGKSAVRKLAGIGFPGLTDDGFVSLAAHVSLDGAEIDRAAGVVRFPGGLVVPAFRHHRTDGGGIALAPFPAGYTILATMEWDRTDVPGDEVPATLDELRAATRRVLGHELPFGPPAGDGPHLLRRNPGFNSRQADRYRDRRLVLLGDAAHVHSAIGGPGLNLGLQDALNLGWKLAAAVRGTAPDDLLDSYEAERAPVSRRVLVHTRAQMQLMRPGEGITAVRAVLGELLESADNRRRVADLLSGADVRYGQGAGSTGRWADPLPDEARPSLAAARGVLLLHRETGDWGAWRDRVDITPTAEGRSLLVRPDGYVAWDGDPEEDAEGLRTALERWFGQVVVTTPT